MPWNFSQRHDTLGERMRTLNSRHVNYIRGAQQVLNILASISELKPDELQPFGVTLDVRRRDYIFNVSDLQLGGVFADPVEGDKIIDGSNVCIVTPMGEEPTYRYTSNTRKRARVHTIVTQ